jgi:hypothetical protein
MKKLSRHQIDIEMRRLELKQANDRYSFLWELSKKCLKSDLDGVLKQLERIQGTINSHEETIEFLKNKFGVN